MTTEFDDYDDAPGAGRVEPHRGTLILVLGILGIVVCGFIGIAAWLMGKSDLEKMKRGHMDREGEGLTRAGYILGLVAVILMAVSLVIVLVFMVLGFGFAAAGR